MKKELKAIRKSIRHWQIDIIRRLMCGDKITKKGGLRWNDGSLIRIGYMHCALCMSMLSCISCPMRFVDNVCSSEDSAYMNFSKKPILENAIVMIESLKKAYRFCEKNNDTYNSES